MHHLAQLGVAIGLAILAGCGVESRQLPPPVPQVASEMPDPPAPQSQAAQPALRDTEDDRIKETELWYDVDTDLANLQAWKERWPEDIRSIEMVGDCHCHVTEYRICATTTAIADFPKYDDRTTTDEIASAG